MFRKKVVNFEIKYGLPLTGGLTMQLVPVAEGVVNYVDEMDNFFYDDGICVNETAFGFIEACIAKNMRDNYWHWGISKIYKDEWRGIVAAINGIVIDWQQVKTITDVMASINCFEDENFYQKLYFEKTRKEFFNFVEAFLLWGNKAFEKYKTVVVLGV